MAVIPALPPNPELKMEQGPGGAGGNVKAFSDWK